MKVDYKKSTKNILMLAVCVLAMYASTKAQNAVTNGTFDTDLTGWQVTASGGISGFPWSWTSYSSSPTTPASGSVNTTYDNGSTDLTQSVTNVKASASLSFDLRADGGSNATVGCSADITVSYAGIIYVTYNTRSSAAPQVSNGAMAFSTNVSPNSSYTFTNVMFTLPANIPTSGKLDFQLSSSCGFADNAGLDNIFLSKDITTVLPITLTNFTGQVSGCTTNLVWETAYELNSKFYSVEYSTNGSTFYEVGKVLSQNSANGASYNYAYPLGSGTGFFRLKEVDFDGTFKYSIVVTVVNDGICTSSTQITVSANPTAGIVNIQGLVIGSHVTVIDEQSKILTETNANSSNQSLNLSTLTKGIYILKIETADGKVSTSKVVKL